jgi:hypothetical protein
MMKRTFLRSLGLLLAIATFTMGATATDVTSSKNELLAKGASPHVRYKDDSGDDYTTTVNGSVFRVANLDGDAFLNVPPTGTIGLELNAPTSVAVTPFTSGGFLADGDYFYVVTALDGFGETIASSEVQCTISGGGGNGRCDLTWAAVSPPAQTYRVYQGTGATLEDNYADGIVGTSYSATTDPLPDCGPATTCVPPDATTAYFIRLAPDGIHYSDGSVQSSAGGASAWQVPPATTNIINAQGGNIGLSNGSIFVPDAKFTVIGNGIDLNDFGAFITPSVSNIQMRSNYKISTDRLWNTGLSTWAVVAGDGSDEFAVYRAPATAGAPVYAQKLAVTSTGFLSKNFSETFGASTLSAGSYTFQGSNTDVNINAGTGGTASLNFNVAGSKGFVLSADGTNTQFDFSGTLSFNAPVGGSQVASISPAGLIFGAAGLTTNGDVFAAGRIRGSSMGQSCAISGVFVTSTGTFNLGPPVTITAGGSNHVRVDAQFNGEFHSQNSDSKAFIPSLLRNNLSTMDAGDTMIVNPVAAGTQDVPVSWHLQNIDLPSAGSVSYNTSFTAFTGTWNGNNYLLGTVKICAYEIP